ncbi:MAG: response regulator transcription factor [Selenomonadaceae bacterium]|nr:response regulator transcription factor [Selenomonadaceae bacterium]
MIKILIADDQELIRESLKIVLDMNADMKVVGLAEDGQKVLDLLNKNRPDIILMDIRMPELDGVLCTKIVKEKFPDVKIIILTTFDDDEYVFYALKYGASGYLLKGCSVQELTAAIHTVMNGGSILNQGVITKVVKLFSQLAKTNIAMEVDGRNVDDLNRTERNIASLVGCGLSNKEIAEKLFLSEGTVRNALSSALSKLHLRDRTQLAIWAVQTGLPLMTTN